jgi:hypothetical protein
MVFSMLCGIMELSSQARAPMYAANGAGNSRDLFTFEMPAIHPKGFHSVIPRSKKSIYFEGINEYMSSD